MVASKQWLNKAQGLLTGVFSLVLVFLQSVLSSVLAVKKCNLGHLKESSSLNLNRWLS